MPKFKQVVAVFFEVTVEAEDANDAYEKVQVLSRREILNGNIHDIDTDYNDEMPWELP